MNLSVDDLTAALARNRDVFAALFQGASPEMQNWRQAPEKWNLVEIACHMYDEELEDFRARTFGVLESPEEDWVPIDPANWVKRARLCLQKLY